MKTAEYLDRLLLHYSGSFDIYQPYKINGKEYPAYGYFFSSVEKYVLVREANMWTSKSYEHILFLELQEFTIDALNEIQAIMETYMEPELVRKGSSLPEKNHMYSYLSISVIVEKPLSKDMIRAVKKFKFEKGYRFNIRGYSQGRILCCSMENEQFISNYAGKNQRVLYKEVFNEVRSQKSGFHQMMKDTNMEPFTQL